MEVQDPPPVEWVRSEGCRDLLTEHCCKALAKQLALQDFLAGVGWQLDVPNGTVTFGGDRTYPVQLLGTESNLSHTWLWAWANDMSDLPEPLLKASHDLKNRSATVPEFGDASFPLALIDGHRLSMIASGLNPDAAYYRGPNGNGSLFFLVQGLPEELLGRYPTERVLTVLNQCMTGGLAHNHKTMAESFLDDQGFEMEEEGNVMTCTRDGDSIVFIFDEYHRITALTGRLAPNGEEAEKRELRE